MKLNNIRTIGRFINPETGSPVNVKKGCKSGYGVEVYFFLRSGSRVLINEREFFGKWKKVSV